MRKKVILYNPKAPYYTLPLQFLALASVLDRRKYEVCIIDARVEKSVRQAHEKVIAHLPEAACVGISVITGVPIVDAVNISKAVKSRAPSVPVVWGGWHPSIYPEQCLREGNADYCIAGQGEMTFLELLDAFEAGEGFEQIQGLSYFRGKEFVEKPERKFIDINNFPSYDYGLIPLETYFRLKRMRQIDFYSSQGCPYRCAFCADPYVYNRRWSGLKSGRMLTDVFDIVRRYSVEDVNFQDENFFANKSRVLEFCEGLFRENMNFSWSATSRADQVAPLDDAFLEMASKAHFRKAVIGAESGSQGLLDFMKKDTLAEETLIAAEKLARHNIGATFNFIVGFPEEQYADKVKTLNVVRELKKINPRFEFGLFFFTPYPGTELFEYLRRKDYHLPASLTAWAEIDFTSYAGYWVSRHEREHVERFKFYARLATEPGDGSLFIAPLQKMAETRVNKEFFRFPVEKSVIDFVRHRILHRANW